MYGLAYVIIPASFRSLQAELDAALAAFRRGGDDEFPRDKLAFDDATADLHALHASILRWSPDAGVSCRSAVPTDDDPELIFYLDPGSLIEHLAACGLDRFEGALAEVEPDFDRFAAKFARDASRDPASGRYGRWLNPLGRWDWWELGGRFNGVIVGDPRRAAAEQVISSGENAGRDLVGGIARAFGAKPSGAVAEIEANIELVATLLERAGRAEVARGPTAIVLPNGCGPDEARWFDSLGWRPVTAATRELLGAASQDDFATLMRLTYGKFRDHAAAGVAYHF